MSDNYPNLEKMGVKYSKLKEKINNGDPIVSLSSSTAMTPSSPFGTIIVTPTILVENTISIEKTTTTSIISDSTMSPADKNINNNKASTNGSVNIKSLMKAKAPLADNLFEQVKRDKCRAKGVRFSEQISMRCIERDVIDGNRHIYDDNSVKNNDNKDDDEVEEYDYDLMNKSRVLNLIRLRRMTQ